MNEMEKICLDQRNFRLFTSDYVFLPDSPIDPSTLDDWKSYRQSLRNLPETDPNWPNSDLVIWPEPPIYKTV